MYAVKRMDKNLLKKVPKNTHFVRGFEDIG